MKATSLWVGRVPSIDEDDEPDTFASAPTVALIGAGPSGMFFLHALATRIRDLEATIADAEAQAKAQGNANGNGDAMAQARSQLANLPVVTCYEMSDGPGGCGGRTGRTSPGGTTPKCTTLSGPTSRRS